MEKPKIYNIKKIIEEARDFRTFIFQGNLHAKPGQFIMLWLPDIDEKPISISYQDDDKFAVSVMKVGLFTEELFKLKEGDKLGIRGPYGNPFTLLENSKVCLVGGGCGSAPLAFLANELKKRNNEVDFIIGARSHLYLAFQHRMDIAKVNALPCTDDGSFGFKGFTTQLLEQRIKKNNYAMLYTCGPEIMMKKIVEICEKNDIEYEASLERHMKCGFGLCGQCCVDDSGHRVCKEGPVFNREKLMLIKEFGIYKRKSSGMKDYGRKGCDKKL